ncbi:MAG: porin family protein [Bacteroidia bacterium]
MKKEYLLGLFLIMFTGQAFAQETSGSKFRGGLKINPSFTWLKTEKEATGGVIENNGARFGFSYGVFGDYYFAENYGISTELRVAHLSSKYTYFVPDNINSSNKKVESFTRIAKLQYIELPVSLKMRTNEVGYMRYYGQFGFVPAVNIKAKADDVVNYQDKTTLEKPDQNIGKQVNLFAMSLQIGAGVEYNLGGSTSLLGGITFYNGFTNLIDRKEDNDEAQEYRNFNVKPVNIALNLGVIF